MLDTIINVITILFLLFPFIHIYVIGRVKTRTTHNMKAIVRALKELIALNQTLDNEAGEINKDIIILHLIDFIDQINKEYNL